MHEFAVPVNSQTSELNPRPSILDPGCFKESSCEYEFSEDQLSRFEESANFFQDRAIVTIEVSNRRKCSAHC